MRLASSPNHSRNAAPYATSPRDSASGLPCSRVIKRAKSSWFSITRSNQRRIACARSFAVLARHAGSALFAASMAPRASARLRLGTRPRISPVAGLSTANEAPDSACNHFPSTYAAWRNSRASFSPSFWAKIAMAVSAMMRSCTECSVSPPRRKACLGAVRCPALSARLYLGDVLWPVRLETGFGNLEILHHVCVVKQKVVPGAGFEKFLLHRHPGRLIHPHLNLRDLLADFRRLGCQFKHYRPLLIELFLAFQRDLVALLQIFHAGAEP